MNLEKETAAEIAQIERDFKANKDKVIDMLVAKVLDVDLAIPSSVKEKFSKKKWIWLYMLNFNKPKYKNRRRCYQSEIINLLIIKKILLKNII